MPLFQVIVSTNHGQVYELDLHAPDAPSAVARVDQEVRDQEPRVLITHLHARHINGEL